MDTYESKIFKGTTNSGHQALMLTLPKEWVAQMGINPENRDVSLYFDGDIITVQRAKFSGCKKVPLASNNRIYSFAVKWLELFKNHNNIPDFIFTDHLFLGRELSDLGFFMDTSEAIQKAFPNVKTGVLEDLKSVIDKVEMIPLGNAIFSQWRYFSHWAIGQMDEEDYQWFILAFTRLVELSSPKDFDEYYDK